MVKSRNNLETGGKKNEYFSLIRNLKKIMRIERLASYFLSSFPIFAFMKKIFAIVLVFLTLCMTSFAQSTDSTKSKQVDAYLQKAQNFFASGNVDSILHYYKAAQSVAKKYKLQNKLSDAYYEEAKLYLMVSQIDSAIVYFKKAADVARSAKYWIGLNKALGQLSSNYSLLGRNIEALQYAKEAIEAGHEAHYIRGIAIGHLQAGNASQYLASNEESLQNYQEASKYFDSCGYKSGTASCWINMASIYYVNENFDLSLEFSRKAIGLQRELGNLTDVANAMQNIAAIYSGYNRRNIITKYRHPDSVFYYYKEANKIYEQLKDSLNLVKTWTNLGLSYMMIDKDWKHSKEYLDKAYKTATRKNYTSEIISVENSYAMLYQQMGQFEKSREYFLKEYPRIIAGNYKEKEMMWYRDIAQLLDSLGESKEALHYYEKYVTLQDTLRRREVDRQMNQLSAHYGSKMKDQEIAAAKDRQQLMQARQDELQMHNKIMTGAAIIIAFFLLFVIYLFIQKRKANVILEKQNDKINKQNIEIEHQKNEVVAQKERIEVQQHNILDSIHYASRIQTAILPQKEVENQLFGDNIFILFKPRDIVSGDFFWMGRRNNWKITVAADCTGHGVPGAFMSMLGTAFLNEIINDNTIQDIDAGQILNKLRDNVIKSLRQTGKAGEQKDGMDVALWMIDENTNMLRYAGANNPLIIVRKEVKELNLSEADAERVKTQDFVSETDNETYQIIQIAGSKMPIGIYADLNPFEDICLQLYPGDTLYTFSDGFQDQFGGVKGKKFMIKRLKQLFVDIYTLPMDEQRTKLDSELVDWIITGNTEQIDDILVIGYRV